MGCSNSKMIHADRKIDNNHHNHNFDGEANFVPIVNVISTSGLLCPLSVTHDDDAKESSSSMQTSIGQNTVLLQTMSSSSNSTHIAVRMIEEEMCTSEVFREAKGLVRKALQTTPFEHIVLAGIPFLTVMAMTSQHHVPCKDLDIRQWIDTATVEVRYDNAQALEDAWHVWKHVHAVESDVGLNEDNRTSEPQDVSVCWE
eukprot:PhF_6_TR41693/c0_g1_i3/m.63242